MRMTSIALTATLTAFTLAAAIPASAGTTKPNEVQTSISAQDLASQAGIKKAYQELQEKAETSCRVNGPNNLANRMFERSCETRLMNAFIEDVDHAGLTAYHQVQKSA